MGADADLHVCGSDGGKVRFRQILLAEMDEARARVDRFAPIVVDHELATMRGAERDCFFDLGADNGFRPILQAKLHQPDAVRQKTGEPVRIGEDRIKRIEADHGRARTGTGQEA